MSHRPVAHAMVHIPERLWPVVAMAWPGPARNTPSVEVQADFPMLYWRASTFDGTTVTDEGQFAAYPGTVSVGGVVTMGRARLVPEGALHPMRFNGTAYLSTADDDQLDIGLGDRTWMCWFRCDRSHTVAGNEGLWSKCDAAGANGFWLYIAPSGDVVARVHSGAVVLAPVLSGDGVRDGRPHHVAVVLDRANQVFQMYLDGQLIGSTSAVSLAGVNLQNAVAMFLGCLGAGGTVSDGFAGSVDEVAYYQVALPATRVATTYAAGLGPPDGFVGQPPAALRVAPMGYALGPVNAPFARSHQPDTFACAITVTAPAADIIATSRSAWQTQWLEGGNHQGGFSLDVRSNRVAYVEATDTGGLTSIVASCATGFGSVMRLVANHTGSLSSLSLNGTVVGTMAASSWSAVNTMTVGMTYLNGGVLLDSPWSDLALFSRALTPAELVLLAAGTP